MSHVDTSFFVKVAAVAKNSEISCRTEFYTAKDCCAATKRNA